MKVENSDINHDISKPDAEDNHSRLRRSEFVEEIISNRPTLLVRWGTLFFFSFLVLIGIISWLVKYPDIVPASVRLTSINAPKSVIAFTSGNLIKLFVTENEKVHSGQTIGYIETTANYQEAIKVLANLDSVKLLLENNRVEYVHTFIANTNYQLGELQSGYQVFIQAYLNFKAYLKNGFYIRKKVMLWKDLANLKRLNKSLLDQKGITEQDYTLSKKTFDANESLRNEKIISDYDYRNEQSKLLNKKISVPQINSSIILNESQQNEKEKELAELDNAILQQKVIFEQALNTFRSQIYEWKKKYVLIAPIEGTVVFASFLQEKQQIHANQVICYVNPGNSKYYGEMLIPQSNFGKIKIGQDVLLKFPSYPYAEFGTVRGRIEFVNGIPSDSGYLSKIILPNDLLTSFNKKLQYREGLVANAEIVTDDKRLLEKFYYNIIPRVSR
jgi:biotin carboxyl carrier protein